MGSGLAVAIGVADQRPEHGVVAILGDGDLMMGIGSLASLSGLRPPNLLAVVLNDGRYSITGGQEIIGGGVLDSIARVLPGVSWAEAVEPGDVEREVRSLPRPGIVNARITDSTWPGPSPFVDPASVRIRFLSRLRSGSSD
jgi:hypothetical protein